MRSPSTRWERPRAWAWLPPTTSLCPVATLAWTLPRRPSSRFALTTKMLCLKLYLWDVLRLMARYLWDCNAFAGESFAALTVLTPHLQPCGQALF